MLPKKGRFCNVYIYNKNIMGINIVGVFNGYDEKTSKVYLKHVFRDDHGNKLRAYGPVDKANISELSTADRMLHLWHGLPVE